MNDLLLNSKLLYILIFFSGSAMGSFLFCQAHRFCNGERLTGRSCCDYCGHVLRPFELVPVFSYLIQKGRCPHCGKRISILYPLSEVISGIVYLLVLNKAGWTREGAYYCVLFSLLLYISFCDLLDFIIPDLPLIMGVVLHVLYMISIRSIDMLLNHVVNGFFISVLFLILAMVMSKVMDKPAMGGGDIKLLFLLAMHLSMMESFLLLSLSSILAFFYILIKRKKDQEVAFGPFMCLSFFIIFLVR